MIILCLIIAKKLICKQKNIHTYLQYLNYIDSYNKKTNSALDIIPNVVWSYWNSDTLPDIINKCFMNWKRYNPHYTINIITPSTINMYIPEKEKIDTFNELSAQKQSDWIRLYILSKYGGIWLDASIILTESLDWIHVISKKYNSNGVGFYFNKNSVYYPHLENWFLAVPRQNKFIIEWFKELDRVCRKFSNDDNNNYLKELKSTYSKDTYDIIVANTYMNSNYFNAYLACQVIMVVKKIIPFHLESASEGPYYYQSKYGFGNVEFLVKNIESYTPRMIKLINGDRNNLIKYIEEKKVVETNSLYNKYLV